MSASVVLSAARQTDRISHSARIDTSNSQALLGVALGQLTASVGSGGARAVSLGAATVSGSAKKGTFALELRELHPRSTSGKVEEGSPDTFLGPSNLPAAMASAQKVSCNHHKDKPIRMGSTTVLVNKKRLSRQTDETACGALLCDGEATVLVGGAPNDATPPDPLRALGERGAVSAAGFGAALTACADLVGVALDLGASLVDGAGTIAETVIESATVAEGEIAATMGSILGSLRGALLGPLYGEKLGDKGKGDPNALDH